MSATLAPPTLPPTPQHGGGGGGDGEVLRQLSAEDWCATLDDWAARTQIYRMSTDDGVRARHADAVGACLEMRAFAVGADCGRTRRLGLALLGETLVGEPRTVALVTATLSRTDGLAVSGLAVHPAELNEEGSTAELRMLHALHVLADEIEMPLEVAGVAAGRPKLWERVVAPLDQWES